MADRKDMFILGGGQQPAQTDDEARTELHQAAQDLQKPHVPEPVAVDPAHPQFEMGAWEAYAQLYGSHGQPVYEAIQNDPACPNPVSVAYLTNLQMRLQTPMPEPQVPDPVPAPQAETVNPMGEENPATHGIDQVSHEEVVLPNGAQKGEALSHNGMHLGFAAKHIPAGSVIGVMDPDGQAFLGMPGVVTEEAPAEPEPDPEPQQPDQAPLSAPQQPEAPQDEETAPEEPAPAQGPVQGAVGSDEMHRAVQVLGDRLMVLHKAKLEVVDAESRYEEARVHVMLVGAGLVQPVPADEEKAPAKEPAPGDDTSHSPEPDPREGRLVDALTAMDFPHRITEVDNLLAGTHVNMRTKHGQLCEVWFDKAGLHATPREPAKDPAPQVPPEAPATPPAPEQDWTGTTDAEAETLLEQLWFTKAKVQEQALDLGAELGFVRLAKALLEQDRDAKGRITVGALRKAEKAIRKSTS